MYWTSTAARRSPGSLGPGAELLVENKLRRKLFVVKGTPAPAKIVVREMLNSRLGLGLNENLLTVNKGLVVERNPWLPQSLTSDMDELLTGKTTQKELTTNRAQPPANPR